MTSNHLVLSSIWISPNTTTKTHTIIKTNQLSTKYLAIIWINHFKLSVQREKKWTENLEKIPKIINSSHQKPKHDSETTTNHSINWLKLKILKTSKTKTENVEYKSTNHIKSLAHHPNRKLQITTSLNQSYNFYGEFQQNSTRESRIAPYKKLNYIKKKW